MSRVRIRLIATAATLALVSAPAVTAAAAPSSPPIAPTNVLTFTVPAIGGIEAGPASVPGGSFRPVKVTAQPGIRTLQYPPPPPTVTFAVQDPAPYHYQYSYRYLRISWRNLNSGKTGQVDLRHWQKLPTSDGYPASLTTQANASTGAGPVVATVRVLREQYQTAPSTISVIPGLTAIDVPR